MTIHLIISFVVKLERVAEFVARTNEVKVLPASVPGCKGVRIHQDAEQPNRLTFIEAWSSLAHHQAHVENVQRSGEWDRMIGFLTAAPMSSYYREL